MDPHEKTRTGKDKINANAPGYDAPTPEFYYEQRIADLKRQLAEKQEEIEAMRPDVERYRWLRSNNLAPSITGIWYGDFTLDKAIDESRKQP